MRRFRKWFKLSPAEKRIFLEASLFLWLVRLALWLLPFRIVSDLVSAFCHKREARPDEGNLAMVTQLVVRAARYVPVGTCLTQALATKMLLARRGVACEVRFGARKSGERLEAHAWVERNGQAILGDPLPGGFSNFRPLLRSPEEPPRRKPGTDEHRVHRPEKIRRRES